MKYTKYVNELRKIKKKYEIENCINYRYNECQYRVDYFIDLKRTIEWFIKNKNYNGNNSLSGLLNFIKDNE